MKEYLKNILPRIQNTSKMLNKIESFVDKPWVLIEDGMEEFIEYEFYRDNRLLISNGGDVQWGKWELTPSSQRLLLSYNDKVIMMHNGFIDDAVMILKKSNKSSNYFIFANQNCVPDLNIKAYLENKYISNTVSNNSSVSHSTVKERYSIPLLANKYDENNNLIEGYKWVEESTHEYGYYENSQLISKFYLLRNKDNNGNEFFLFAKSNLISKGDVIYYYKDSRDFIGNINEIKLTNFDLLKIDNKGIIVIYRDFELYYNWILALIFIVILLTVFLQ